MQITRCIVNDRSFRSNRGHVQPCENSYSRADVDDYWSTCLFGWTGLPAASAFFFFNQYRRHHLLSLCVHGSRSCQAAAEKPRGRQEHVDRLPTLAGRGLPELPEHPTGRRRHRPAPEQPPELPLRHGPRAGLSWDTVCISLAHTLLLRQPHLQTWIKSRLCPLVAFASLLPALDSPLSVPSEEETTVPPNAPPWRSRLGRLRSLGEPPAEPGAGPALNSRRLRPALRARTERSAPTQRRAIRDMC